MRKVTESVTCSCGKPASRRREPPLCSPCYMRAWKRGLLTPCVRIAKPLAERIRDRVLVDANGCWLWTGQVGNHGYGTLSIKDRTHLAHRVSYEAFVGEIPEGLQLDHLCRVRACVNPRHLEPVTARENVLRSPITRASLNAAKTHCPQGHEYTPDNIYADINGGRTCKACKQARSRDRYMAVSL